MKRINSTEEMEKEKELFLRNIYDYGRRERGYGLLAGTILFLLLLFIIFISAALADQLFYFSTLSRWGLLIIHLFFLSIIFYKYIFHPFKNFIRYKKDDDLSATAQRLSRNYTQQGDAYVNTYQLMRSPREAGTSDALREAAIKSFLNKYGQEDYKKYIRLKDYLPSLKFIFAALTGGIVILALQYNDIKRSALRLLNPANEYALAPQFSFNVQPGDIKILKGQAVTFRAVYRGPALKACFLELGQGQPFKAAAIKPMKFDGRAFILAGKDIRQSTAYRVRGEADNNPALQNRIYSQPYKITVHTPPLVRNLDITLKPPKYTGLKVQSLQRNVGDFSALPGTKVKMKISATKILRRAFLIFSNADSLSLAVSGLRAGAEFVALREQKYQIVLIDTAGVKNQAPIRYQISLLSDEPPFIEIIEPGQDVEGRLEARLNVKISGEDDYGLNSIKFHYQIRPAEGSVGRDTSWRSLEIASGSSLRRGAERDFLLDFAKLPLAFGDELRYYASATDNRTIGKPGAGRSRIYSVTFPTLEDLFSDFDQRQDEQIDNLEQTADKAKELKEELEKIDREMKRAEKIDWEKKQQVEKALKKQTELRKKVEEIQEKLQQAIDKLADKQLISPEVLEKYSQLQTLLQELMTPELQEALNKLQQAAEQPDAGKMRRALKEFRLQQEIFRKNIERALELLKQVRLEQQMDALLQQAENLSQQQEKTDQKLKKDGLSGEDFRQLQREQQEQQSAFENFHKQLEQFSEDELLKKFSRAKQEIDSTLGAMRQSNLKQNLRQLGQHLKNQDMRQSRQRSNYLQRQFSDLAKSMSRARQSMMQQSKQQVMQKMARAAARMLQLSFRQEELKRRTKSTSALSEEFAAINRAQGQILSDFDKVISTIVQLSKETFALNPQISKSLRGARQNMRRSVEALSERNKNGAQSSQGKAMGALNQGVLQLKQSMAGLAQSKSGTGFEQLMQQLQQMAGSQGMINDESMNIFQGQGNKGSMGMRQQQAMARLASRQAALQQAMQELDKQIEGQNNIAGDLGGIAQQMDEVVKDLLKQNIDRQTLKRQRRILSRMLDAQKSLQQREYSKKRRAIRANKYRVIDPVSPGEAMDAEKRIMREAMRKARQSGYSKEYRQLIEAYFKKRLKEE